MRRYGRMSRMKHLLHVLVTAAALAVATWLVPGIELQTASSGKRIGTLLVVALIVGIVDAVIKPIVKTIGCLFYILTLGLIGLVVNGLLLWLASWVAGQLKLPFHITGFWPAFWGAIIIGVVGWILSMIIPDGDGRKGRND
jgi:putative membrane protein